MDLLSVIDSKEYYFNFMHKMFNDLVLDGKLIEFFDIDDQKTKANHHYHHGLQKYFCAIEPSQKTKSEINIHKDI